MDKKTKREYEKKFGKPRFAVMSTSDFFKELDEKIKFKEEHEKKQTN